MSLAKVTILNRSTHSRPTRNASVSGSDLQKEGATISGRDQAMSGTDRTDRTDPALAGLKTPAPAGLNTEN